MNQRNIYKEVLFQVAFHLVAFVFYSFDRSEEGIEPYRYAYFINYALTAAVINYISLPIFYKRKKIVEFVGMVVLCILISALMEELILEKIYFEGRRADTIRLSWAILDIIPVVAILSGVKFGWDAIMKHKQVDKLEAVIKESELQFLKSQINPHFLFNNLNNLYSYALGGSTKTPEIILELSGLLRYMLYECKEKFVPLSQEISQLQNFINLNELQIEDRGKVNFTTDIVNEGYKVAPLIMIVFIENAFKHSQSSQSSEIEIDVHIDLKSDGVLKFQCSNSYSEIANQISMAKGIGLQNVKKRLELIYPNAYKLKFDDHENKFVVGLEIDLNKGQE